MKNSKRVIVGAMALLSAVSVASCGSSSGGDSSSSYVDKVKVATPTILLLSLMVRKRSWSGFLILT